jgi:hypothetical protein
MNKKLKVGILSTFSNFDPAFSLCSVTQQLLIALVKYGYEPALFVLDCFTDDEKVPKGVEIRKVIPKLVLEPYTKNQLKDLDSDSNKAQKAMEENMKDIDVCLTQDIIFINSYLPYNVAMRKGIEGGLSHIKWLHWIHSAPSLRPRMDGTPYDNLYNLPPHSRLIYLNYTDVVRAAEMFGIFPKDVRTIFNMMDIRELYNFDPITRELIEQHDLMSADYIDVYPLSTTRMNDAGKQLSKVIWVMSYLKKMGNSIRLIVPNAHANAQEQKEEIEQMYRFATDCGMERRELIFTSLHDVPKYEQGVPRKVVTDLFQLSNLFIFPSVSEASPLILKEAMAAKCLLVLNYSFPAMRDFAGENALYFRFGSLVDNPEYPLGLDKYLEDVAKLIVSEMEQNKALKANTKLRKEFNVDYIAKHMLIPTIEEAYAEL